MIYVGTIPDRSKLAVRFEYDEALLAKVKSIQGRVWNKKMHAWLLPFTKEMLETIRHRFAPTQIVVDPAVHTVIDMQDKKTTDVLAVKNLPATLPTGIKFHLEPFEHQKKALALCLKYPSFGLFMDMGCVSGDTLIEHPLSNTKTRIDELAQKGGAFDVLSWSLSGWQIAAGAKAFLKGIAELFEITLSSGEKIQCTKDHVFLTAVGWKPLSEIHVGESVARGTTSYDAFLAKTNVGSFQQAYALNDPSSLRTIEGWITDCSVYPHLCGQQLRSQSINVPARALSRGDVLEHSDGDPSLDGLENKLNGIHSYLFEHHLANKGFGCQTDFYGKGFYTFLNSQAHFDDFGEVCEKSQRQNNLFSDSQRVGSLGSVVGAWTFLNSMRWGRVESIIPKGLHPFYDMHVPILENYVANGIVNHNTGKTKVIIDLLGQLKDQLVYHPALVICPVSVMENWKREAEKSQPDLRVRVLLGTPEQRKQLIAGGPINLTHLYVTNYESTWRMEEDLLKLEAKTIILDESTKIKHRATKQAKSIMRLSQGSTRRYIMSGTPMPNSPLELFNQFKFLDPNIFGTNFYVFRDRYAMMGGYGNYQIIGYKNLDELGKKIAGASFRVTKDECLDLPDKIFKEYRIPLEKDLRRVYEAMADELVMEVAGNTITATSVLAKLTKLRQITAGFVYQEDGTVSQIENQPKLTQLKEILTELAQGNHKIIIWGIFTHELTLIEREVVKIFGEDSFVRLDGSTPALKRQEMVDRFQTDHTCKVFLGQQHAGGLGITLTAADYCIFYSNDYSPEIRLQCEDRAHRIGQKKNVTYIDLIIKGTIDSTIKSMLKKKSDLTQQINTLSLTEVVYGANSEY